ncbi:FAT4-like protein [Mya arenaria]|uniref:FAT4-like protein n=1 Tax=Mya arenaria TaxID=6604 RepID=A0ABY7FMS6_MYAAR|nr:FAT4-like protein [Mya arenaria]
MRVFAALADKGTTCNLHVRANKNRNVEPVHCFHSQNNIYCKEPAHCFNAYHCINYKEPAHCFNGYGVAAEEDPCKGKPCSLTGECAISRLGKCTCKKGFKFEDETNTKCVDMDECGSHFHDPCEHRGICHNFVGGYRCICSEGWTHTAEKGVCDIDIDECKQSDACSDKGLCNNTDGFVGDNCTSDRDECTAGMSDRCSHRGHCFNTVGSFRCECLSGWNGTHCEHSTGEKTACMPGYSGQNCGGVLCKHGYAVERKFNETSPTNKTYK